MTETNYIFYLNASAPWTETVGQGDVGDSGPWIETLRERAAALAQSFSTVDQDAVGRF